MESWHDWSELNPHFGSKDKYVKAAASTDNDEDGRDKRESRNGGMSWDEYKEGARNYVRDEEDEEPRPKVPESCCNPTLDQVK